MKKNAIVLLASVVLAISVTGCNILQPPSPTATQLPTATSSPTRTATSTPTRTLTPEPQLELQTVLAGGYSFLIPAGWEIQFNGPISMFMDEEKIVSISLYGEYSNPNQWTPEEIAEEFLEPVFRKSEGDYVRGEPRPIETKQGNGTVFDVEGHMFDWDVQGQALAILAENGQWVFGLGMSNLTRIPDSWANQGETIWTNLIESIDLLEAVTCTISTDPTYGYEKDNPIRVGGGAFGGPSRERAFLDNLLGPNGERLTYVRNGSLPYGDTILDEYDIRGPGFTALLYTDEYSFSEPVAPVGFTCSGLFPLEEPE
jgi:hypothetical protein